jgi:hypothetical protein
MQAAQFEDKLIGEGVGDKGLNRVSFATADAVTRVLHGEALAALTRVELFLCAVGDRGGGVLARPKASRPEERADQRDGRCTET